MKKDICPNCKTDLAYKHTDGNIYSNKIGIEDPEIYDGVSWYACSKCCTMWKRFDWSPDPKKNPSCKSFIKQMKKDRMDKQIKEFVDSE